MERLIGIVIVVGTLIWLAGIRFFDGRWQWQMFAGAIIIVGIIAAHIWEEVYQHKDEEE